MDRVLREDVNKIPPGFCSKEKRKSIYKYLGKLELSGEEIDSEDPLPQFYGESNYIHKYKIPK